MFTSNVHVPVEVSQYDAVATGLRPISAVSNPLHTAVGSALEVNAPVVSLPVQLVGLMADVSQVAKAIVCSVMVDMVNNVRLLAVGKEPSKPVGKPRRAEGDGYVALQVNRPSNVASFDAATSVDLPSNDSRFRVIYKVFTDRIRDNFVSHVKSPLDVVRGLVVGATSTPIIPMVSNIGNKNLPYGGADPVTTRKGRWFFNLITLERAE